VELYFYSPVCLHHREDFTYIFMCHVELSVSLLHHSSGSESDLEVEMEDLTLCNLNTGIKLIGRNKIT
jgi:hypothetical protein